MSLTLPKTCAMGDSQTALVGTIGVTILKADGTTHTARATVGIYEIGGGCYGKDITFDDDFAGSIKWDTGGGSPVYATEEYSYLAHNPDIDVAVSSRNAVTPPTVGAIRTEMETVGSKLSEVLLDTVGLNGDVMRGTDSVPTNPLLDSDVRLNNLDTTISSRANQNPPSQILNDYKADVTNLDVAVSSRNAVTPPTVGTIRTEMETVGSKLSEVLLDTVGLNGDVMRGTDSVPTNPLLDSDVRLNNLDTTISSRANQNPPSQVLNDYKADVTNLDVAVSSRNAVTPPTVEQITADIFGKMIESLTFEELQIVFKSQLKAMFQLKGLDIAEPMTVTPTSRKVGTMRQTITGDGKTTSTVTRTV